MRLRHLQHHHNHTNIPPLFPPSAASCCIIYIPAGIHPIHPTSSSNTPSSAQRTIPHKKHTLYIYIYIRVQMKSERMRYSDHLSLRRSDPCETLAFRIASDQLAVTPGDMASAAEASNSPSPTYRNGSFYEDHPALNLHSNGLPEVHVLAVDDSLIDRRVIEKLLRTSAYKVTVVDSGIKALEILGVANDSRSPVNLNLSNASSSDGGVKQEFEINLIITDYCMPEMTGYDLLKKIKATSALKEIPVVVMSSENVPNRISSCLAEGAEEFLLKPVQLSDVQRLRGHVMKQTPNHETTSPTQQQKATAIRAGSSKRKACEDEGSLDPSPAMRRSRTTTTTVPSPSLSLSSSSSPSITTTTTTTTTSTTISTS